MTLMLYHRDCILELMENRMAAEVQPTCPLCRADIHSGDLVVGVNAAVPSHQDDAMLASLQEQASSSDSKLQALLNQVLCCRPELIIACHHQSSCCGMLCYAVLYCGMLCCAVLFCAVALGMVQEDPRFRVAVSGTF